MLTVQREMQSFKLRAPVAFDVPLSTRTTFRVGGPADVLVTPRTSDELAEALAVLAAHNLRPFILGGGANIVVSDAGIRGVVVELTSLSTIRVEGERVHAEAGAAISEASAAAAEAGLTGLDFIYAMPGTVGGAVWMNARCYDGEIAAVLESVDYLTMTGERGRYATRAEDFAYKVSPFQDGRRVITAATFCLGTGRLSRDALWERMHAHEADRTAKGHFAAPSAGSMFKNDRAFGRPSGQIIDEAGLRGHRVGGAQVSPGHGNIVINTGLATASEIRTLVTDVQSRVYRELGLRLETEVLFVGDWERSGDSS